MRTGIVNQFDSRSPYGFIEDDLTGASYFVFYKSIKESGYKRLEVGQRVRYQLAQGKKGLQCINVYVENNERG
ncbi:MAG: cold shock domain-containing protein [Lactobacillus iners]|nr:cold shock domain-containing protein [Lactobacillus iners]